MSSNNNLTPFRVWLRSYARFPYISIVWAKSKTAACRIFAQHLKDEGYRFARVSPGCYETTQLTRKFAERQRDPITLYQEVS